MSGARLPVTSARAGHADASYTPARVVDVDLARPYEFRPPGGLGLIQPVAPVLALVRLRGHPLGMVATSGDTTTTGGPDGLWLSVAESACRQFAVRVARHPAAREVAEPPSAGLPGMRLPLPRYTPRPRALARTPFVSVIVATHNRPELLRDCLNSLLRMNYPRFEVIVVDNAPADDASERLIREEYGRRLRYIREPTAGLARAHNRGLAAAHGRIAAFTDDDTLVDPDWLSAVVESFAQDPAISCVTGLIVPAELETAAQAALERHGQFAKGYVRRTWSLHDPPEDPLFPFTAGRFGSGTNMAFLVEPLRGRLGFDPATGTGTPAYGGDDLLAFFRVLTAGHTIAYQPDAIVWHRHRRAPEALDNQAFGYGAGLGAYLTGALLHEPRMIPALLRRLPRGIRYATSRAHGRAQLDTAWSRRLALLELRGLLYGPFGYLRSHRLNRTTSGRC
ncbi:glycosyltransferase family 2 protein [Streptomyces sp. NPDC006365]|uniref:glycosyltransferase family 2 protein n=1 Tax=Streptomyces sp. NPDC006365 TaxID=3364744 RepID=UPI0036B35D74